MLNKMQEFITEIENIIDSMVSKSFDENANQKIKYTINQLDEARINFKNNKYYDIFKILSVYPDYWNFDDIMMKLKRLAVDTYDYFLDNIIDSLYNVDGEIREELEETIIYISNIEEYDLFEELANYVLNDCSFDDNLDLVKVYGLNVKDVIEREKLDIVNSYIYLINRMEKAKSWE